MCPGCTHQPGCSQPRLSSVVALAYRTPEWSAPGTAQREGRGPQPYLTDPFRSVPSLGGQAGEGLPVRGMALPLPTPWY